MERLGKGIKETQVKIDHGPLGVRRCWEDTTAENAEGLATLARICTSKAGFALFGGVGGDTECRQPSQKN